MEPNSQFETPINNQDIQEVNEVINTPIADETYQEEGLLNRKNIILALLLFLSILFISILLFSAKYYFDNQNQRPATVQSIPTSSSSASTSSSTATQASSTPTSSSSAPAVIDPKVANVNSDSGLLIRKDDGALKYPNPSGPKQGSFDDKESIKVDTTKGKKEFTINGEKLSFVYATGATRDGWIAEKFVVYK